MRVHGKKLARGEAAVEVARLRAQGLTFSQVAKALDMSVSYANELDKDPDGSKSDLRRQGYRRPCPECGKLMTGSNGLGPTAPRLCAECTRAAQHDRRCWTRERIIREIQDFAEAHGRPPLGRDCRVHASTHCAVHVSTAQREFGSWGQAIEAAGFPRPRRGHYERKPGWTREEIVGRIRARADTYGETPRAMAWQGPPALRTILDRFGSWNAAIAAAGLQPRPRRGGPRPKGGGR